MKLRRSTIMMNRRLQLLVAGCALLFRSFFPNHSSSSEREKFSLTHNSKSPGGCPRFRFLVPGSWGGLRFSCALLSLRTMDF